VVRPVSIQNLAKNCRNSRFNVPSSEHYAIDSVESRDLVDKN
jgi:hypothetical protein